MQQNKHSILLLIGAAFAATAVSGVVTQQAVMPEAFANLPALKGRAANNGKFYSDYLTHEACIEAGEALDTKIAEEGITLLKNDGTLPMTSVKKVTIFGKNGVNPAYFGYGAGASQSTRDPIDLYEGLEASGYETNPVLKAFYENDARSGSDRTIAGRIGESPVSAYDDAVKASFNAYSDAAIVVLTRVTQEGSDPSRTNVVDQPGDTPVVSQHYLKLSKNETDMIALAKASGFGKIIVIVNCATPMELGTLQDDAKINGIVWVGCPGHTGFKALGEILKGTVNPSGHLADTFARDFTKDPTYYNFGDNSQSSADGKTSNYQYLGADGKPIAATYNQFAEYEEGIYFGYRYWETAYADEAAATRDTWYKNNVVYPFGYGLSYTSFSITNATASVAAGTDLLSYKTDKLTYTVTVKNTGSVAGKDVVQLYYHSPYIDGQVEKADEVLGGFAKTDILEPGESQDVSIDLYVQDMASYDYNDANANSHKGYELDAGAYQIRIASDAHTVEKSFDYLFSSAVNYDTDRRTGKNVENRFDNVSADAEGNRLNSYNSMPDSDGGVGMTMMTRKAATHFVQPQSPTVAEATVDTTDPKSVYQKIAHEFNINELKSGDYRYKSSADVPSGATQVAEDAATRTLTNTFAQMVGVANDDPKWDTLINEMKYSELVTLVSQGMRSTAAISSIGLPAGWDYDGPTCINQVDYASETVLAATWNTDLAYQMGHMIGDEAIWIGLQGWYGPGMDTHRSPFGGRNFEYYSEDGLLAGKMAANEIKAAQAKGVYAFAKHFALNEQETSRTGIAVYATEQAIRETYFKPFQLAVEEGGTLGVMTAYNKIGDNHTYGNYALATQILRDEWDFQGFVVTDTGPTGKAPFTGTGVTTNVVNLWQQNIAGNDLVLGSVSAANKKYFGTWNATKNTVEYTESDNTVVDCTSLWLAIRESAKRILFASAQTNLTKNSLDVDGFVGNATLKAGKGFALSNMSVATTANVGTTNLQYSLDSGALPAGVTLNSDGSITGTPNEAGTFAFTVKMTADAWITKSADFVLTVDETLTYAGDDLAKASVGTSLSGQVSTSYIAIGDQISVMSDLGSARVYTVSAMTYSLKSGSTLPDGVSLAADGTISGTPTIAGTYNFDVNLAVTEGQKMGDGSIRNMIVNYSSAFKMVVAEAVPEVVTHTVTFNGNYSGAANTTVKVNDGATVVLPANPVREGYIFTGWFTDAACTKAADFSKAISADTTFYAGWAEQYVSTTVTDQVTAANETAAKAAASASALGVTGIVIGSVGLAAGIAGIVFFLLGKKKNG